MKKRISIRNPIVIAAIILLILAGVGGYNLILRPTGAGKGPSPFLTEVSRRHIEDRHVRLDDFPYKSKFRGGLDYESLIDETYENAQSSRRERSRYIYDYETGSAVGRKGQTSCRLVTEEDGEVVTFFPRYSQHAQRY